MILFKVQSAYSLKDNIFLNVIIWMPTFLFVSREDRQPTLGPVASMMNEMFSLHGAQTGGEPNNTVHLLRSPHAWKREKAQNQEKL